MSNANFAPPVPKGFGAVPDVVHPPCPPEPDLSPPPFPTGCLPQVMREMVAFVVASVRVPDSLAGPTALGIISAAVGAGLEVASGPGRRSRANLMIGPSAESGTGKSEVIRLLIAPLLIVESEQEDHWQRETLPQAKADIRLIKQSIAQLEKMADEAVDADSRQQVRDRLAAQERALARATAELKAPQLIVEDVTTEELAVLLARNGETLASISSDAGNIVNNLLGRYAKNDRTDETIYLKAWSADPVRVNRLSRPPVRLRRPCLSALWMVQPDKVDSLLGIQALTDGGLMPRLLLCHSGCQPQEIPADADAALHPGPGKRWGAAVRRLLDAYRFVPEPHVVRPTPEALALLREHFNEYVRRWRAGEFRDVNGFAARWTEQAWRIALCLHAAEELDKAPGRPLTAETATAAITIADWFRGQQLSILGRKRTEQRVSRVEVLCQKLAMGGGAVTLRDLRDANGFEPSDVRALAKEFPNRLRVEPRPPGPKGGRPSETAVLVSAESRRA